MTDRPIARCAICQQQMNPGVSCKPVPFPSDSMPLPSDLKWDCGDCNAPPGGFHHPGCDMERCPDCKGQALSCGCQDGRDA
jgi:hypothetical protein